MYPRKMLDGNGGTKNMCKGGFIELERPLRLALPGLMLRQ
jgi:hypothetical protein